MKIDKGFSIIVVIVIIVIFAGLGAAGLSLLATETKISVDTSLSAETFYIADGGLQYYIMELQNQSAAWTTPPVKPSDEILGDGTFTVLTENETADEIDVISEAHLTGPDGETIVRVVRAHVTRGEFLPCNYVIYIGGNYTPGATVTGDMTEDAAEFPTVDFTYWYNQAPPSQRIPAAGGSYSFPTGTSSGIWYIDDSVTISSNTTLNGTIVATGSVSSNNKSNVAIIPTLPNPAVVSNDAITFSRQTNLNIRGMIYGGADGNGNVSLNNSNGTVFGKVITPGNLTTSGSGSLNLTYNPALRNNPPPGFSGASGGGGYSAWTESYLGGY